MHELEQNASARRTFAMKVAERRFRAWLFLRRDRLTIGFGVFGFVAILLISILAGHTPMMVFLLSTVGMAVMSLLGFAFGSLLLSCRFTAEFAEEHLSREEPDVRTVRLRLPLVRLRAGMRLDRAAMAPDGRQVLRTGTVLGEPELARLRAEGVREADVIAQAPDDESKSMLGAGQQIDVSVGDDLPQPVRRA